MSIALTPALATPRRISRALSTSRIVTGLAAAFLLAVAACALVPNLIAPGSVLDIRPDLVMTGPSASHLLGADQYGRDILALLVHGARDSVVVGVVSVLAGAAIGTLIGVSAGFAGGWVDTLIMRLTDVLLCFPAMLLALVFQAALGAGLGNQIIAIAVGFVPEFIRLARGQAVSLRERNYVLAARSAGVREPVILIRHIVPHVLAPVVVVVTIGLGTAMALAASLSFLGLGRAGGVPDWGRLLGDGQNYLATAWWITTAPGLAISLVVISANVLGDNLRDRLAVVSR
jgi:peptide/nickel transport system permease protein